MNKLLVVIDYQKDFVDGALGFKKAEALEQGIYDKVKKYLENGDKVLFTYDTHFENYLETREGKSLPVPHCYIDTEGHELYGKLKEFVGVENTFHYNKNAFGIAPEVMLKISKDVGEDIDEIELVGVVTNMCVISNVVTFQSQYINANLIVDGTLCASFDDSLHDKALDVIEALSVKVKR
ncbi:amidase [Clostridium sp. 2-1]|uniref:cysteine hydrolase family protein n=1 Tax=Clostridium TaxID=1485 RepID=UPI000CDA7D98|nr:MULTISPECIES: isochorismatase family cysteine hydrolase [Clostridium]MBN7576311.1 cysteine hydrolase [Clostridium beijerinckii]MBN7579685.1 cysteine hydrolase [Clostridium beijerinckii]MBN7585385.1 cysteine hydrolase [Clostridium beijerinckii]MBO0520773.1 cysteine hydrolase [Clostridium beijerinckii]POO90928.1 amidase [Clostridium sp. 2-1]